MHQRRHARLTMMRQGQSRSRLRTRATLSWPRQGCPPCHALHAPSVGDPLTQAVMKPGRTVAGSVRARGQTAACVLQIAFLAAMVGPKVAAAAAQRALEVLTEDDPDLAAEADTVMADDGQATAGSNGHATGAHSVRL